MSLVSQALEQITDAGVFELLAAAVLRRAVPEARGLIHVGLNAFGRTVKSPIDGIAPGGEQAGYLLVSHTTTSARDLRTKWLDESEGDVTKALVIVRAERARAPAMPFKLALCTNRVPDETLVRDVQATAAKQGVPVVFMERSRLSDFLEHQPDGQWLAAQYLGIAQRRLSADLLQEISAASAAEFATSVLDNPDCWVERALDAALASSADARIATFLIMPPGSGKTVAAVRRLTDWVARGGVGLWVPDAVLDFATTLEQAIDSALRRYVPTLEPFSGSVALSLCSEQSPLLIVIDDITRVANPNAAVERLAAWVANFTLASPLRVVCPVWPQVLETTRQATRLWVQQRSITAVTSAAAECSSAVQRRASQGGSPISQLEAESIAARLGNDLLLVALRAGTEAATPASRIVSEFVRNCLGACATSHTRFVVADYQAALNTLAFEMLTRRVMEPTWLQMSAWMARSPDHLACIREIAGERKLFHLQGSDGEQHLVFRHDRVRASVLASSIQCRLDANELDADVISEPYYAEFLGLALATVRDREQAIQKLKEHNPLALVYAVVAAEQSEVALVDALVSAVLDWLKQPDSQSRGNEFLCFQLHLALASVDSPAVMRVADALTLRTWALDIAKLRNGDAIGGASLCYSSGPSVNDPRRDELIEHVVAHHRSEILAGMSELLSSEGTSTKLLSGALSLAGFLGEAQLADAILSAWRRRGETDLIPEFLWAASLCCGSRPEEIIGPVLDALQQVPDTNDSQGQNQRTALLYNAGLRFGFARRLKGPPVRYLIERAQNSELTEATIWALEKVDDEDAARFMAEQMGAVNRTENLGDRIR